MEDSNQLAIHMYIYIQCIHIHLRIDMIYDIGYIQDILHILYTIYRYYTYIIYTYVGPTVDMEVPTTFQEMFLFNAAVMGFSGSVWMQCVLDQFDNIVTNVEPRFTSIWSQKKAFKGL